MNWFRCQTGCFNGELERLGYPYPHGTTGTFLHNLQVQLRRILCLVHTHTHTVCHQHPMTLSSADAHIAFVSSLTTTGGFNSASVINLCRQQQSACAQNNAPCNSTAERIACAAPSPALCVWHWTVTVSVANRPRLQGQPTLQQLEVAAGSLPHAWQKLHDSLQGGCRVRKRVTQGLIQPCTRRDAHTAHIVQRFALRTSLPSAVIAPQAYDAWNSALGRVVVMARPVAQALCNVTANIQDAKARLQCEKSS